MTKEQKPSPVEKIARSIGTAVGTIEFLKDQIALTLLDPNSFFYRLNPFAATTKIFKAVDEERPNGETGVQAVLTKEFDAPAATYLGLPVLNVMAIGHNPKTDRNYVQENSVLIVPYEVSRREIKPWSDRKAAQPILRAINGLAEHWRNKGFVSMDEEAQRIKDEYSASLE
jgi:hypothetical protein